MTRKRVVIAFLLLIGIPFAVSVFGGEITMLAEKVPSMLVINDNKRPVPVRELGDPGRNAFVFFEDETFQDGQLTHVFPFTVPEGKRLVIESVSSRAFLPDDQTLILVSVQVRVNERNLFHQMGPTSHGKNPGGLLLSLASEARTLYADGGTQVFLNATRSAEDGVGVVSASVSGHLIDCDVAACE